MIGLTLKTPKSSSDSIEGLNDGNIETYKNTPMLSLTKEELQNSTDQALKDENGQFKKVRVEFNDFNMKPADFPNFKETKEIYENERVFWDGYLQNDKKAIRFFESALKVLNQDEIRCLRISDFNTTGLSGIHKTNSSPWNNLVKNKGVSDKPGYSGGSFGIGKDAAFACSKLRIVFYNTINQEGEKGFQGCMKVPNYIHNNETYLGKNFYCKDTPDQKCDAYENSVSLDPSFSRNAVGMDKFIIGFDSSSSKEELRKQVIISSLENFLMAFFLDKLEIKYGDYTIDKSYLNSDELKELELSKGFFENLETLNNPDDIIKLSMFEADDILIYVKLDPNYSRRASVIRQNGMKVFDQGYISGRIGFKAVVYLAKDKVNQYFKTLENQEHNSWSTERAENPSEARNRQNDIFDALREKVRELNNANAESTIDSDGLGEYLPLAYVTGKKNKVESLSNEVEETKKKPRKKKKKPSVESIEEEVNYVEDENGNVTVEPVHEGTNPPSPDPGIIPPVDNGVTLSEDGSQNASEQKENGDFVSKKEIQGKTLSMHLIKKSGGYSLNIKSEESHKKCFFEVSISGEDKNGNIEAVLENATIDGNPATIKDNKILFETLEKDRPYRLDFDLKMPGEWALEVKAYESKN